MGRTSRRKKKMKKAASASATTTRACCGGSAGVCVNHVLQQQPRSTAAPTATAGTSSGTTKNGDGSSKSKPQPGSSDAGDAATLPTIPSGANVSTCGAVRRPPLARSRGRKKILTKKDFGPNAVKKKMMMKNVKNDNDVADATPSAPPEPAAVNISVPEVPDDGGDEDKATKAATVPPEQEEDSEQEDSSSEQGDSSSEREDSSSEQEDEDSEQEDLSSEQGDSSSESESEEDSEQDPEQEDYPERPEVEIEETSDYEYTGPPITFYLYKSVAVQTEPENVVHVGIQTNEEDIDRDIHSALKNMICCGMCPPEQDD